MIFFKTEVRESELGGKGCFALASAKPGEVAGLLAHRVDMIHEKEYDRLQKAGDERAIHTATRWVGDYFLINFKGEEKKEDFLNHNEDPNLLYHCGVLFVRKPIKTGDELTVDYRYLLSKDDAHKLTDAKTGKVIDGYSGQESLHKSTAELVKLINL